MLLNGAVGWSNSFSVEWCANSVQLKAGRLFDWGDPTSVHTLAGGTHLISQQKRSLIRP